MKQFKEVSELNSFIEAKHKKSIGEHKFLIYQYKDFHIINKKTLTGWKYFYVEGQYKGEQY